MLFSSPPKGLLHTSQGMQGGYHNVEVRNEPSPILYHARETLNLYNISRHKPIHNHPHFRGIYLQLSIANNVA